MVDLDTRCGSAREARLPWDMAVGLSHLWVVSEGDGVSLSPASFSPETPVPSSQWPRHGRSQVAADGRVIQAVANGTRNISQS